MEYRLVLIDPRKLPSMSDHELGLFSGAGSFNLLGRPKVGVILAGDADFQWECTEFLADACLRSSSWTGDTVRVYGEGMVAWMQFLAAEELSLSDATEEDLLGFRAALRRRRAHGIWDLSPATIRLRLVAVMQFYRWAQRGRIFASPLGEWLLADNDASGASSFRGRRYRVALADSYLPRVRSRLPAHISDTELLEIIRRLPLPYSLMVKWAVTTGMRRFEICSITVNDVTSALTSIQRDGMISIDVSRKGGNKLAVYVTPMLLEETNWYVRLHRPRALEADAAFLFIGANRRKISGATVSRRFRSETRLINSHATFHHLRHKYALTILQRLQRSAESGSSINPLKAVQVLLGHRNIETTSVYLDALEIEDRAVEEALAFLYGSLPNGD